MNFVQQQKEGPIPQAQQPWIHRIPAPATVSEPQEESSKSAIDESIKTHLCTWDGCEKKFLRKTDVTRHLRIHLNERPYACTWEDCSKSFMQRSAMNIHYRTHTGEKPNKCPFDGCKKAFNDSSSLARHRRTHRFYEPFPCSFRPCPAHFKTRKLLNDHERAVHDAPFPSSRASRKKSLNVLLPTPDTTPEKSDDGFKSMFVDFPASSTSTSAITQKLSLNRPNEANLLLSPDEAYDQFNQKQSLEAGLMNIDQFQNENTQQPTSQTFPPSVFQGVFSAHKTRPASVQSDPNLYNPFFSQMMQPLYDHTLSGADMNFYDLNLYSTQQPQRNHDYYTNSGPDNQSMHPIDSINCFPQSSSVLAPDLSYSAYTAPFAPLNHPQQPNPTRSKSRPPRIQTVFAYTSIPPHHMNAPQTAGANDRNESSFSPLDIFPPRTTDGMMGFDGFNFEM